MAVCLRRSLQKHQEVRGKIFKRVAFVFYLVKWLMGFLLISLVKMLYIKSCFNIFSLRRANVRMEN